MNLKKGDLVYYRTHEWASIKSEGTGIVTDPYEGTDLVVVLGGDGEFCVYEKDVEILQVVADTVIGH